MLISAAAPAGAARILSRFPLGAAVNAAVVVVGGLLGLLLGKVLRDQVRDAVVTANGLATLAIGTSMALKTQNAVIMVMAIVAGAITGELLALDDRITALGELVRKRLHRTSGTWTEGLVTATLIYCVGPMTVIGSIQEGMNGNASLIYTKSILDFFMSISLAASLGSGVVFSAIPLFLLQGLLTVFGGALGALLQTYLLNELTAAGGLMVMAIGINLLGLRRIRTANLLPGLVYAVLLAFLFHRFGLI